MDPDTFFNRIRRSLIELLKRESRMGAVKAQTTTWIRLKKDRPAGPGSTQHHHDELVELAFNSRMINVYNLSDLDEIVDEMTDNIKFQIENPALLNSRFVFNEVLFMNIDLHQLNITRGSSYLPLPDWLACKNHNKSKEQR